MTLKECYEKMEANYDEVIGRLRSERLVQKFALKFLDDPSYQLDAGGGPPSGADQGRLSKHCHPPSVPEGFPTIKTTR